MRPATHRGTIPPNTHPLVAVVMVLLWLCGCASVPQRTAAPVAPVVETTPQLTPQATPVAVVADGVNLRPWFDQSRKLVEEKLNVDLQHIALKVVDGDTIRSYAQDGLLRALKHDIDNDAFASELVSNILTTQSAGSVLAIYSPEAKSVLLHQQNLADYMATVAAFTDERAAVQALLLHELIHAADDVNHQVFDQRGESYQEVFSRSTILEGHAQWQARRLCRLAQCTAAFQHLNHYMFNVTSVNDPALDYIQTRNFRNLEFVYREGERFVDHLMKQNNSQAMLELAFDQPPQDSLQIIDPSSFPNRSREKRNQQISQTIKQSRKPWTETEKGLLTRNIVAAAAFSSQPETRDPIIEFYSERVVAAAKHEYYDRNNEIPIPIAITVMQTDNDSTAKDTASLIFESTAQTYQNLNGQLVEVNQWRRDNHSATLTDPLLGSVDIAMNTAGGRMNNHMVQSEYPFEVVTASSGDFIVHIDGRYQGGHSLMQYAGRLLLELRRRALRQL